MSKSCDSGTHGLEIDSNNPKTCQSIEIVDEETELIRDK